jgi:glycyl-tRNA synthetase beta chain
MDFFVEIGVENIPSSVLQDTLSSIEEILSKSLNLAFKYGGTNRRISFFLKDISNITLKSIVGPPEEIAYSNSNITEVGKNFIDRYGINNIYIHTDDRGKRYLASKISLKDSFIDAIKLIFNKLKFEKTMNWNNISFIRPVRYITAFIKNENLKFSIGDLESSDYIIINHKKILISNSKEYIKILADNNILIDIEDRISFVSNDISLGIYSYINNNSFIKAINSIESPKVVLCELEDDFSDIPDQIFNTAIETYQLGVVKDRKSFYVVCESFRDPHLVKTGNLSMANSRLKDISFFISQDKEKDISYFLEKLKDIIFRKGLGTLYDKQIRLAKTAKRYVSDLNLSNNISKAAEICKFDLSSCLVNQKEFSDLRGYIGSVYAKNLGISSEIANIIFQHYLPRNSKDQYPDSIDSCILSIIDKMDSIVGAAILNKLPFGNHDPYYIRREAISVLNLIEHISLKMNLSLDLKYIIDLSLDSYDYDKDKNDILTKILEFFKIRMQSILNSAFSKNIVNSVIDRSNNFEDLKLRCQALSSVDICSIKTNYFRVKNILKDIDSFKNISKDLMGKDELYILDKISEFQAIPDKKYKTRLEKISSFKDSLESFFTNFMIMDKNNDIRENRLAIMKTIFNLMNSVADLTILFQGE